MSVTVDFTITDEDVERIAEAVVRKLRPHIVTPCGHVLEGSYPDEYACTPCILPQGHDDMHKYRDVVRW